MKNNYLFHQLLEIFNKKITIKEKKVNKGEVITSFIQHRSNMYFLESGEAQLVHYNLNVNVDSSIIELIKPYELFSDLFFEYPMVGEYQVIATKNTVFKYFNFQELFEKSLTNYEFKDAITYIMKLIHNKLASNNVRQILLVKKTTRERLLSYFQSQCFGNYQKMFVLPFSYSELAFYLGVDRCNMMREISNLQKDGIIEKKGRTLFLNHY